MKDYDFDEEPDTKHRPESNGGGVNSQPYVSIDSEDDGSRSPWVTVAVVVIVVLTIAIVAFSLML